MSPAAAQRNAVIKSTRLGVPASQHGILTFMIQLDYGSGGQGFGGIVLDTVNPDVEATFRRKETELPGGLLLGIYRVFQVDWEDLPGKPCRAFGHFSRVLGIGHYLDDRWLWLEETETRFRITDFETMQRALTESGAA